MTAHHALPDDPIQRALIRASGVLPDQGPIGVFIHHNTLHAYQHLPFHQAVQVGAADLHARPYLSLAEFRAHYASGRIADVDVRRAIAVYLDASASDAIVPGLRRDELWHMLMVTNADTEDATGLQFAVDARSAPEMSDEPLWDACLARARRGPRLVLPDTRQFRRHRDVIVARGGADTDVAVHAELIRLGSGFLDQGQAAASFPEREHGFLATVCAMYARGASAPRDCRGAERDLRDVASRSESADVVLRRSLETLGVPHDETEAFLFATAMALPGWGGMFSRLERHPAENPDGMPVSLADFLAVRLLFEVHAVQRASRAIGLPHAWSSLRRAAPPLPEREPVLDAAMLWGIARAARMSPADAQLLDDASLAPLWSACAACTPLQRRQLFQDAFESTYRVGILDALAARRALATDAKAPRPRAQFVFCIDEREESIRRAIEEQHPEYITFGMAGFFGVAIDYQGLYDLEPAAYCPVVVTPGHEVHEQPVYTDLGRHLLTQRWRDRWLRAERRAGSASRSLTGGVGMSLLLGPLSAVKTLARVLAPRDSLRVGERIAESLTPRPTTRLSTLRMHDAETAPDARRPLGFSLDESIDRVTASLTNLGLVRDFAPIIVFLGHGSTSLNNPHESAHDCGACGGRRGGANARLFADMANRPDVRAGVRQRGIDIPEDTWFVGALHDTSDDSVRYYDLERLPPQLTPQFDDAFGVLERARRENARERSRRFENASLAITPELALRHVEERASHLAQPRPEYGHCTNAVAVVGRRMLTRGLHLDRRPFLISYDPTIDKDDRILERILAAVGPVGAGISLEYYFSSVDNEVFGCGTKLPHNVTGLIGVMNGHQSDLRTGLPLQMVEIHEPMRLLLIVDASPEALLTVAGRQAEVAELVVNAWVQLVSVHPETGAMAVFERGAFVPYMPQPVLLPVVERSPEWHMRTRAHITPALVRSALPASAVGPGHTGEFPAVSGNAA